MCFRLCQPLEVGQVNFLFKLIYTLIPLTVCFDLRMDHPESSSSSEIHPVFGLQQKSNRNKRQIFQVNADCPAQGQFCALQRTQHRLSSCNLFQCLFSSNYPLVSSPSNTWMERVLHRYIYWLTWGMELIYFGKWIWCLSSSSLFQIPFPGTGKLFAKLALFL